MAISNYSQIVKPAEYQNPMDLNLYLQGTKYQNDLAEKNIQQISNLHNSLLSIPAHGKDMEKLQQIDQELQNSVKNMNLSNLGDLNTFSQLKGLINSYTSNPDVMAIAKRSNLYNQMLSDKKDAESKGRSYINSGLDKLNSYYSGNDYIRDLSFSNDGYLAPEMNKLIKAASDLTPEKKRWITRPDGQRMQESYKDINDIRNNLNVAINSDPTARKYLDYKFNQEYANTDWETEGRTNVANRINKLYDDINYIANTGGDASPFIEEYNKLNNLYTSGVIGEPYKQQTYSNWYNNYVNTISDGIDYVQQGEIKMDELEKLKLQHSYKLAEDKFNAQLEAGLVKGIPAKTSDLDKEIYKAAIASGKPIYNNDGTIIPAKQLASQQGLAYNAAESRDGLTAGARKTTKVTLDGKGVDKETILNDLNLGNISTIEKILKSYPDRFNTADGIDPGTLKISNGVVTWEDDDTLYDDKRNIELKDIIDFVNNYSENSTETNTSQSSQPNINTSNTNIATPSNFTYQAKMGNDTIYSIDGNSWYNSRGTKVE